MNSLKVYQVALQLVPGIGNANAKHLISYVGKPEEIFNASRKKLHQVPGMQPKTIKAILDKSVLGPAEKIVKACDLQGITILHYTDGTYPRTLKLILDAPNILYFKGNGNLNPKRSISIVGTRNATEYGKDIVDRIIRPLKVLQPVVYSGLAYGIDIYSHREALNCEIPTFAVLAGGLDKIYPGIHFGVAEKMMENDGGIISEHPPGVIPEAHQFPARNRIIAGISEATVVIEAAIKGGALITAEIAYSYQKPVFAVPGDIGKPFSAGCNELIRSQKALILTSEQDIYYQLNWDLDENLSYKKHLEIENLTNEEQSIINVLNEFNGSLAIDELAWRSQVNITKLASILLNLEFKGIIKSLPGKKFSVN